VPLTWDQHTGDLAVPQSVNLYGETSAVDGHLTRVWHYVESRPGHKDEEDSCHLTIPVVPRYYVVPGGDDLSGPVPPTGFTIIVAWYFPFDPGGETTPDGATVERALKAALIKALGKEKGSETGEQLVKAWESLPWVLKFGFNYGLMTGGVGALGLAAKAGETALKVGEGALKVLKAAGNLAGYLHSIAEVAHDAHTGWDIGKPLIEGLAGMYEGLLGTGDYPVMGVVLRGQFTTTQYDVNASMTTHVPLAQTLALSATGTQFPNIVVKVTRDALQQSSSDTVPPPGPLPWANQSGNPFTQNPFSDGETARNPPYLLVTNTKSYPRGRFALDSLVGDMSDLIDIDSDIHQDGSLEANFGKEQEIAAAPSCSDDGVVHGKTTICWVFDDARP
jgi:hypothetical protein